MAKEWDFPKRDLLDLERESQADTVAELRAALSDLWTACVAAEVDLPEMRQAAELLERLSV